MAALSFVTPFLVMIWIDILLHYWLLSWTILILVLTSSSALTVRYVNLLEESGAIIATSDAESLWVIARSTAYGVMSSLIGIAVLLLIVSRSNEISLAHNIGALVSISPKWLYSRINQAAELL